MLSRHPYQSVCIKELVFRSKQIVCFLPLEKECSSDVTPDVFVAEVTDLIERKCSSER